MHTFQNLLQESRLLSMLHENMDQEIFTSRLYQSLTHYFNQYTEFNHVTANDAILIYQNFISAYSKHAKKFIKTGVYPLHEGEKTFSINRQEYDLVLLLSVLFTEHRFRIMQLINEKAENDASSLCVGVGPGLELLLTNGKYSKMDAYDVTISDFLYKYFPRVTFYKQIYDGQNQNGYNAIFLIEILEHLADPFELLQISYLSLAEGGRVYLTTATDIPQFDHLYNFPADHVEFEHTIKQMGFAVEYTEQIHHKYFSLSIKSSNRFYILRKL